MEVVSCFSFLKNSFIEIQFTHHTNHPFKVSSSMAFHIFSVVQPPPQSNLEKSSHLQTKPCALWPAPPTPHLRPQGRADADPLSVRTGLYALDVGTDEITRCVASRA